MQFFVFQAHSILPLYHDILENCATNDKRVRYLSRTVQKLRDNPVAFTEWKLFILDSNFTLTVILHVMICGIYNWSFIHTFSVGSWRHIFSLSMKFIRDKTIKFVNACLLQPQAVSLMLVLQLCRPNLEQYGMYNNKK